MSDAQKTSRRIDKAVQNLVSDGNAHDCQSIEGDPVTISDKLDVYAFWVGDLDIAIDDTVFKSQTV
jgi:hypothetical protein